MDPHNHPFRGVAADVLNHFVPDHAPNLTPDEAREVKRYLKAKEDSRDDDVTDMPYHREVNGAFDGFLAALARKYGMLSEAQWNNAAASTWWEYHLGDGFPHTSDLSSLCHGIAIEAKNSAQRPEYGW